MVSSIQNNNSRTLDAAIGIGAGYASYKALPGLVKRPYGRWLITEVREIPETQQLEFWKAGQKALQTSGLAGKGVELKDINSGNLKEVTKDTFEKIAEFEKKLNSKLGVNAKAKNKAPRSKWKYILFGPGKGDKLKTALEQMSKGNNACFHNASNNVYVNKEKMGFSVFHEMGHAINANTTTARKVLSSGRHITAFGVPLLLFTALVKRRKPESETEPKNIQRKKNFLKDNIGLLTFACLLPTVVEEGLASINGAKLAKDVLSPEMLKKLNVTNAKAFGSYALGAVAISLCAQLAVYVKDKVFPPKK